MLNQSVVKVIGYQWVSSRPHSACPACASLHGQKFYTKPKDGQKSVADMPTPPLHPNCRCTRVEMVEVSLPEAEGINVQHELLTTDKPYAIYDHYKPYMQSVAHPGQMGFIWRDSTNGNAPIYGKYCGDNWSAGRDVDDPISKPVSDGTPEDSMDEICKDHDKCYDGIIKLPCDKMLIRRLNELDPDPSKWPNPPTTHGEIEYARKYRGLAILAFRLMYAGRCLGFLDP